MLVSLVCFSLVFFVSLFEKNLTYPHLKISISHDGVDIEISNTFALCCSVFQETVAVLVSLVNSLLHFFCLFRKEPDLHAPENFHIS